MAKVRTFILHPEKGVHDAAIAEFITTCEEEFYVRVVTQYIPEPTPRLTVIVTKFDEKDPILQYPSAIHSTAHLKG
jgi:hypothetical protein